MTEQTGIVIKNMNGYFYVQTECGQVLECKVRGRLKKERYSILVGDKVALSDDGMIESIQPRQNAMIRPAVANVNQIVLVVAARQPDINELLFNKLILMIEHAHIPLVICINKWDLADDTARSLLERYKKLGYQILTTSTYKQEGIEELRALLAHKITAFAGPSGVGKSSLLNAIDSRFSFQTGAVSEKIKRGRHTTRHASLYSLDGSSFIIDTPGFSAIEFKDFSLAGLADLFPEFAPYQNRCKFSPCSHIHEPICGVRQALEEGHIDPARYEAYQVIRQEIEKEEDLRLRKRR